MDPDPNGSDGADIEIVVTAIDLALLSGAALCYAEVFERAGGPDGADPAAVAEAVAAVRRIAEPMAHVAADALGEATPPTLRLIVR